MSGSAASPTAAARPSATCGSATGSWPPTSTSGHRVFVTGRGWTLASDLRPGDGLRTVAAVLDRRASAARTVYD